MIPESDDDRNVIHDYAGGEIRSRRGIVNAWLIVVYVALGIWAVYYLIRYWGGLGPGLGQ
jgi:hypothetical protein